MSTLGLPQTSQTARVCTVVDGVAVGCSIARFIRLLGSRQIFSFFRLSGAATRLFVIPMDYDDYPETEAICMTGHTQLKWIAQLAHSKCRWSMAGKGMAFGTMIDRWDIRRYHGIIM